MSEQDIQLKRAIVSVLSLQGIKGVDITVTNGEKTLSGRVSKRDEMLIMKIAVEARPGKLTSFLTVTDKEK